MSCSMPSNLLTDSDLNWSIVENISISLITRRQKRSNFPKIDISLKSNCLPLGICWSFFFVRRYWSWYASDSLRHASNRLTKSDSLDSHRVSALDASCWQTSEGSILQIDLCVTCIESRSRLPETQIRQRNHSHGSEMDTSRVDGV